MAEVIERGWIVWVLKRMRGAVEDKVGFSFLPFILPVLSVMFCPTSSQPKQWTELQAGIECLTQLLLLIDAMSTSSSSTSAEAQAEAEAASTLRHQLIYNGEVLDIAYDSIKSYKDSTQSLAYLDSSVHLAWALLRMLEKWGKAGGGGGRSEEMYVRKKKGKKSRKSKGGDEDGVPDVEVVEEDEEEVVLETMFTFEAFEMVCRFDFEITRSADLFILATEICQLGDHANTPRLPCKVQGVRVLREHEANRKLDTPAGSTRQS